MPYCNTCGEETKRHAFLNKCLECGTPYGSVGTPTSATMVTTSVGPLGNVLADSRKQPPREGTQTSPRAEEKMQPVISPVDDVAAWGDALASRIAAVLKTRKVPDGKLEQATGIQARLQKTPADFSPEQRTKVEVLVSGYETWPVLQQTSAPQGTSEKSVPKETTEKSAPKQASAQLAAKQTNEKIAKTMDLLESARKADQGKRNQLANAALESVNKKPLAELTVDEQIKLLGMLQLAKNSADQLPEPQRAAIVKLYGVIRLDKSFRQHDKQDRTKVLEEVTNPREQVIAGAQASWGKTPALGDSSEKKDALRRVHELQCAQLQMEYKPGNVVFQSMREGNCGFALDKTVKVSTHPTACKDFNEVLDTTIHETTHAYQRSLVEALEQKLLTVDDPRYAQACLFKLNGDTYIDPPPQSLKQTDEAKYNAEYLAYKRQPVEEHAWKAGGEASRAFDVDAAAVSLASVVADLGRILPNKGEDALAILEKFRKQRDVRQSAAALVKIDALAEEAFPPLKETTFALVEQLAKTSGMTAREDALRQYNSIVANDDKVSHRERLQRMSALAKSLEGSTGQSQVNQEAFEKAHASVRGLMEKIFQIAGAVPYNEYEQLRYGADNFRGDAALKLERMAACQKALEQDIAAREREAAESQSATSQEATLRQEFNAAKSVVDELIKAIDERILTEFKHLFPKGRQGLSTKTLEISRNTKKGWLERKQEVTQYGEDLKQLLATARADLLAFDEVVTQMKPTASQRLAVNNLKTNAELTIAERTARLKAHAAYGA